VGGDSATGEVGDGAGLTIGGSTAVGSDPGVTEQTGSVYQNPGWSGRSFMKKRVGFRFSARPGPTTDRFTNQRNGKVIMVERFCTRPPSFHFHRSHGRNDSRAPDRR
jgi:hypothetical protein